MITNSREAILAAAKLAAQAHGYNGLNFRDLAIEVGIKAASIYHHFPSKSDLGVAVAKRYWEDAAAALEAMAAANSADHLACLRKYPETFRVALETSNRMCMCSLMASEYDDLPREVQKEVQNFTKVNVTWLSQILVLAGVVTQAQSEVRAYALFAAISGAQLVARGRSDISLYDSIVESYRSSGLIPN